jgi:putative membrane protein
MNSKPCHPGARAVWLTACLLFGWAGCEDSSHQTHPNYPETSSATVIQTAPTDPLNPGTPGAASTAPTLTEPGMPSVEASPTTGSPTSGPMFSGSTSAGAEDTSASLSDGQIAALAEEVSTEETERGRYAAEHANDGAVRRFAQRMAERHSEIYQKIMEATQRQGIVAGISPRSSQMNTLGHVQLESLKSMTGSDFDRAYMDDEIKAFRQALNLFDSKLIPNAKNEQLRTNLRWIRPQLAEYLGDAQSIRATALGGR